MNIVLILLAMFGVLFVISVRAMMMAKSPLMPAMTPGELAEARDKEFFAAQAEVFLANGFDQVGDYSWHEGFLNIAMRVFHAKDDEAYGWAVEEVDVRQKKADHNISLLSLYEDGTVLDTTTRGSSSLRQPKSPLRNRDAIWMIS